MYNLVKIRPDLDLVSLTIATDVLARFLVEDPVVIDLSAWVESRKIDVTTQLVSSKMRGLEGLGMFRFAKDGTVYTITKGPMFSSIVTGGQVQLVKTEKVKPVKQKTLNLQDRKNEFLGLLMKHKTKYDRKMLMEFFGYWTAEKDGKMRFEDQYFDISRRLATWYRNSTKGQQRAATW